MEYYYLSTVCAVCPVADARSAGWLAVGRWSGGAVAHAGMMVNETPIEGPLCRVGAALGGSVSTVNVTKLIIHDLRSLFRATTKASRALDWYIVTIH